MAKLRRQRLITCSLEKFVPYQSVMALGSRCAVRALALSVMLTVCRVSSFWELPAAVVAQIPPTGEVTTVAGADGSSMEGGASSMVAQDADTKTAPTAGGASGSPPTQHGRLRPRRKHLFLNLRNPGMEFMLDMAPNVKHPCLQRFAELVSSIPQEGSAEEKARALVGAFRECGIQAVAADFDQTMLNMHTGGAWSMERLSDLKDKMSSDFIVLAQELNKEGIPLHVVTFSDPSDNAPALGRIGGVDLVTAALRVNGNPFHVESIVAMRPDLHAEEYRYQALGLDRAPARNKSFHIRKVAERSHVPESSIVLVDDDRINSIHHYRAGSLALHVLGEGFRFDNIEPVTTSSLI